MKLGFNESTIHPEKPSIKFGPVKKLIKEVKGDLVYKIFILKNEQEKPYILVTLPIASLNLPVTEIIHEELEKKLGQEVNLTLACSHTHYSVNLNQDTDYRNLVVEKISETIKNTELKEYKDLSYARQIVPFEKVGTCRISGDSAHVYLEVLSLFEKEKRIASFIVYNSHPTTLNFFEEYFSSVGPGLLQKKLEQKYPQEAFYYMIGAAGDVSTRFTRKEQTYAEVERLTEIVFEEVNSLLRKNTEKKKVNSISFEEKWLPVERKYLDILTLQLPEHMTEREKETLEIAKNHGDRETKEEDLPKQVLFQRLVIEDFSYIFSPFEMFSEYLEYMDLKHGIIVNCANDHVCYLSGLKNKYLSFELFSESISKASKKDIIQLLKDWSKGN